MLDYITNEIKITLIQNDFGLLLSVSDQVSSLFRYLHIKAYAIVLVEALGKIFLLVLTIFLHIFVIVNKELKLHFLALSS